MNSVTEWFGYVIPSICWHPIQLGLKKSSNIGLLLGLSHLQRPDPCSSTTGFRNPRFFSDPNQSPYRKSKKQPNNVTIRRIYSLRVPALSRLICHCAYLVNDGHGHFHSQQTCSVSDAAQAKPDICRPQKIMLSGSTLGRCGGNRATSTVMGWLGAVEGKRDNKHNCIWCPGIPGIQRRLSWIGSRRERHTTRITAKPS